MAKGRRTVLPFPDGSPERLCGGERNEVLRYGETVVRLSRDSIASVTWEHEACSFLAEAVPEVVAATAEPETAPDGRVASAYPYVEGTALDRHHPGQRLQLARVLARLHLRGLDWGGPSRPGFPSFVEMDFEQNAMWDWTAIEDPPAVVCDAYEDLRRWVSTTPTLVRGLVHGDVYRGNTLVRDGRIVGLIDWEWARVDWPAWELANATWEVCKIDDALDPDHTEEFIAAYVDAGGPGETEPFDALLRLRLLADILYSLTSKAHGEAFDQDYVDHLLRALTGSISSHDG